VLLPLHGVSAIATSGETFHDAEADRRCVDAIRSGLEGSRVSVRVLDTDINDEAFARECATRLLALL
jgi:uncharacterized protein (UPF0261 family)